MEIVQIVGLGLVATIIIVFLRQSKTPENAILISVVFGAGIFLAMMGRIANVISVLQELTSRAGINQFYLQTILKVIGVAYIAEFGAQVCRDAGEGAVATRMEFAAKILILILALPIIGAVLESVLRLLP